MAGPNERIAEIEGRVVQAVRQALPPGWRRADLRCKATVAAADTALTVLTADGTVEESERVPDTVTDLLMELRRVHYLSEQGTWFSMSFFVEPGSARPLYNYDFDPGWDPPAPVEAWRRDQIVLPRDGANQPGWLRDRLEGREPAPPPHEAVGAMDPIEQMELLSNDLAVLVAGHAPPLWLKIFGYYQAVGGHVEFPPMMLYRADGTMTVWTPPAEAAALLDRLRAGTHGFQGSTWCRTDFEVVYENGGVRCRAGFTHDDEPKWNREPSAEDVRRELERFPRDRVPGWMTARLASAPPPVPAAPPAPPAPDGGLRRARVFDHAGPDGSRPAVSRPPVPPEEAERVADYLRRAPVVMAARSHAPDRLDPARGAAVPLTFHTDGTWVWSGAVGYYLREHGVPPEADLVAHMRARGFEVPGVGDDVMDAATAAVTGRDAPDRVRREPPARDPDLTRVERPPAPREPDRFAALRSRLDDLNADPSAYRIGGTAEGAWSLLPEGARWTVFQTRDGEPRRAVTFDDHEQAAAHLLGSVLLQAPKKGGPIEPVEGEPPLSLLRDRHMMELARGTTVDRYGAPGGNVVYAAHTPFEQRSLPPDWRDRPYHAYRLQRPVGALTGTAVPWFDQPGGGTAYVFRRRISELLADGTLTEVGDTR
ncbi:TNT domain-containing protein [Actinomadura litoris]|uniref:TNT domain-containing protein n=1 Tax=Actinomadura litoris TaxID=2678616 RepID=UPI001FA7DB70|nr:TNT domain-containing protein [Actinomadura litoris]